ncbi:MAG: hypothetical protein AAF135_18835 [Bacteroidota bacterium]
METLFVRHLLEAVSYLYYLKEGKPQDLNPLALRAKWEKEVLLPHLQTCAWYQQVDQTAFLQQEVAQFDVSAEAWSQPLKPIFAHVSNPLKRPLHDLEPDLDEYIASLPVDYAQMKGAFLPQVLTIESTGNKGLFPQKEEEIKNLSEPFAEIWKQFEAEFQVLRPINDIIEYGNSLYSLLSIFSSRILAPTCTIPEVETVSFTNYLDDVSLFNRIRTLAARSICLHTEGINPKSPYLLIKGDLSGIQSVIYSYIDKSEVGNQKGLSKRLRGRSFYISLVTDYITSEFARVLRLPVCNVIYKGGGGFLLIAPHQVDTRKKIAELSREINLWLYDKLDGRLSMFWGATNCKEDLFENFSTYYEEVSKDLGLQKSKRYQGYLEELFAINLKKESGSNWEEQEIGRLLPYAHFILEIETSERLDLSEREDKSLIAYFPRQTPQPYAKRPHVYYFMPNLKTYDEKENEKLSLPTLAEQIVEISKLINSYKMIRASVVQFRPLPEEELIGDFQQKLQTLLRESPVPVSFVFNPVGTEAPLNEENYVMDFDKIQVINALSKDSDPELSYPLMAVMRLDVDNLGRLFRYGLRAKPTFERTATLSQEMHLFFAGYFQLLAKEWKLYVTYAGGDDAFVVGSWFNVMHFAHDLNQKFRKFVCHNPEITFSAGIFLCSPHYPVARFAKMAGDAEHEAKNYQLPEYLESSKNAIHVFDQTMGWDSYEEMLKFGQKLLKFVAESAQGENISSQAKISRAFVHRLMRLIKSSIDSRGRLNIKRLMRSATQLKYLIARQGFRKSKLEEVEAHPEKFDQNVKELTLDIIKHFLDHFDHADTQENILKNYLVPTQYVILKTRRK